jgi:fructokinase
MRELTAGLDIVATHELSGGYRNNNLLLECADGARYVLRRYQHENRAEVEAALARLMADVVPVAPVVAEVPDALLLAFVRGTRVDELLRDLPAADARALGEAAGRVLASIGTFTFERDGFFTGNTLTPSELPGDLPGFVARCLDRMVPSWNLTPADQDGLLARAERYAPLLTSGAARLVHADFNAKNLLAERDGHGWRITAVLDWEFAFSGNPLADLGNVLRFGGTPFTDGVVAGAGPLPDGWRETAQALDLFALADFLTRPPKEPLASALREVLRTAATPPGKARPGYGNRPGPT